MERVQECVRKSRQREGFAAWSRGGRWTSRETKAPRIQRVMALLPYWERKSLPVTFASIEYLRERPSRAQRLASGSVADHSHPTTEIWYLQVIHGGRLVYACRASVPLRRLHTRGGHCTLLPSTTSPFCQGQEGSHEQELSGLWTVCYWAREWKHRAVRVDRLKSSRPGSAGMGCSQGTHSPLRASRAWLIDRVTPQTLVGPYPSKVESLALTFRSPRRAAQEDVPSWSTLRLFSAGGGSELVEWDIEKGCIKV